VVESGKLAQNLLVYGYLVEKDDFPNTKVDVGFDYQITLRGKSANQPMWE